MIRGLVKICGVTTALDAAAAVEAGADFVGVNLYSGSPRFVKPASVGVILSALGGQARAVAVTVSPDRAHVADGSFSTFDILQWHDQEHEPRPWLSQPLVPAFAIQSENDLMRIRHYVELCRQQGCLPQAILIDAFARGLHGGTGKAAPWHMLVGFDPGVPIILAGGLKPENVAEAIRLVKPYAVDVASGVESEPGRKDHDKMRRFIDAAREAFIQ
jgi:phosphoribosylanthranilate isomerase